MSNLKVHVTNRLGRAVTLSVESGAPLMHCLTEQSDVEAICGGVASCGTCHVYIDANWDKRLTSPNKAERGLLEGLTETLPNSRLACQIVLSDDLDGIRLKIAPEF